jgi:hypothetical protein
MSGFAIGAVARTISKLNGSLRTSEERNRNICHRITKVTLPTTSITNEGNRPVGFDGERSSIPTMDGKIQMLK